MVWDSALRTIHSQVETHDDFVQFALMTEDTRPDPARRLEQARLRRKFKTARAATDYFGWNYNSYVQHESGVRGLGRIADQYAKGYRVSKGWLLTGEGDIGVKT